MKKILVGCMAVLAVLLAGCVTTQPKQFAQPDDYVPLSNLHIESRFQSTQVTASNLAAEASHCVPQLLTSGSGVKDTASRLPLPAGTTISLGHVSSASQFQITRSTGICLRQSEARYTILAAEAFLETVNPVGVPPDVVDDWYKQIARKIAESGSVKVAYVYASGNAALVSYWLGSGPERHVLYYTQEFKKAGAWDEAGYGLIFRHANMASVSETKRNGIGKKSNLIGLRS